MRRLLTTLVTLVCLLAPAVAHADNGVNKLLRDACNDEHVDGRYTQAQYKKALDQLATDSDEYTDCRNVLERARLAALSAGKHGNSSNSGGGGGGTTGGGGGSTGGGGSSGSSGSSAPANPLASATDKQRKALAQVGQGSAKPVDVGGKLVQPGALGVGTLAGSGHDVPTPLIALIALLAASALGAGGWWLWRSVLARRFG